MSEISTYNTDAHVRSHLINEKKWQQIILESMYLVAVFVDVQIFSSMPSKRSSAICAFTRMIPRTCQLLVRSVKTIRNVKLKINFN